MPRSHSSFSSLEVLESRIAPALLINGANLLGGGSPATGESSAGGNSATVVKMISGQAVIWYQDSHIVGISVGPNASLEIHGDVEGDIVANLTAAGRLSDSDNNPLNGEDGAILLPNNIAGIKTFPLSGEKGSVHNIITAGSVTNVNVQGQLNGLYAGDGVFDPTSHLLDGGVVTSTVGGIDHNPIEPGTQSSFFFTKTEAQTINPAAKLTGILAGASVTNVTIGKAVELQMFAGSGNPNALPDAKTVAGGSVRTITITDAITNAGGSSEEAAPSYEIHAGAGSSGPIGGAGGVVDRITEKSSSSKVVVYAGDGGEGRTGAGGVGGSISNFIAGSDRSQYVLASGNGGDGIPGGAGGNLLSNSFANRSSTGGLLVAGNFDGDSQNAQDLIIINQGTGEIVVEKNKGDGTLFTPIVQHGTGADAVTIIPTLGNTPVAAYASFINNDDKLDLVVAYKDSNSLGIFLNHGGGVFYDATLNDGEGGFDGLTVGLQFTPSKIVEAAGRIVVAENGADGTSALHLLTKSVDTSGVLTYSTENGLNGLSKPITDLVTLQDGSVIVATSDGGLRRATVSSTNSGKPFDVSSVPLATVAGGIVDLDVDSAGTRIVALSTTGHAFSTFDFSGTGETAALALVSSTTGLTGKQLIAHFISDGLPGTADQVAVLESLPSGSRVDLFSSTNVDGVVSYTLAESVNEVQALKNFVPVYSKNNDAGFAGISGALNKFTFSDGFVGGVDYSLPFASKSVMITAGHGGDGKDITVTGGGLKSGYGGAGGSILTISAEANEMILTAGNGGAAKTNAGGAGGSISNPAAAAGTTSTYFLHAEKLTLKAGDGGTPTDAGTKLAAGGAGGSLGNLNVEIGVGDLALTSGKGGDSKGGNAGAGGNITGIVSLLRDGNLTVQAGAGGNAATGAPIAGGSIGSGTGGNGGSVLALKHELRLEPDTENKESAYSVTITAGAGGTSVTAAAGNGGVVSGLTLKLDEANVTSDSGIDADGDGNDDNPGARTDSTLTTLITAGRGGNGGKGGNGGVISGLKFDVVLDQATKSGAAVVGPSVLGLRAGDGGTGNFGPGGNGGSITLTSPISGLTGIDRDADPDEEGGPTNYLGLLVHAGDGGFGLKGGQGGDLTGLTAQNELYSDGAVITATQLTSASLTAGDGGDGSFSDGGRGGNIANTLVGVRGGYLDVVAGNGGEGGSMGDATSAKLAKGGAGGAVTNGEFGLVSTSANIGMIIAAGNAGDGYAAGGAGGLLSGVKLNASQSTNAISASLVAGNGGAAQLASGLGGKGGDVTGVSQVKDINSSINLLRAGNGGDNAHGKAGAGGNVAAVKTVGFIGRPSNGLTSLGVFDTIGNNPQGVFSGRGGATTDGTAGLNGSVTNIVARQIAAIAAAMDSSRHFAAASKVSGITADLIGFDKDRDGLYDNANGSTSNPGAIVATDGFIFSQTALVNVTGQRPGFVFIG